MTASKQAFVFAVAATGLFVSSSPAWATTPWAQAPNQPALLDVRASTGSIVQAGAPSLENTIATIADAATPGLELSLAHADLGGALEIHNVSSLDVVVTILCATQAERRVTVGSGSQAVVPTPACTSVI